MFVAFISRWGANGMGIRRLGWRWSALEVAGAFAQVVGGPGLSSPVLGTRTETYGDAWTDRVTGVHGAPVSRPTWPLKKVWLGQQGWVL